MNLGPSSNLDHLCVSDPGPQMGPNLHPGLQRALGLKIRPIEMLGDLWAPIGPRVPRAPRGNMGLHGPPGLVTRPRGPMVLHRADHTIRMVFMDVSKELSHQLMKTSLCTLYPPPPLRGIRVRGPQGPTEPLRGIVQLKGNFQLRGNVQLRGTANQRGCPT